MIPSSTAGSASSAPSILAKAAPKLGLALLAGLATAIILMPLHVMLVSATSAAGYYMESVEVIAVTSLAVGAATRLGARASGLSVAVLGLLLALLHLIGSEYLVAHFLVSQAYIESGSGPLPLLLTPRAMLLTMVMYFQNDPGQIVAWVLGLPAAFLLGIIRNVNRVSRYPVSSVRAAGPAAVMPAARPSTAAPIAAAPAMRPAPAPLTPAQAKDVPAEAYTLGQPLQAYYTRTTQLTLLGGFYSLLGIAILGWIVIARQPLDLGAIVGLFGLLFLGLGGYRLYLALTNWDNQVLIFNDGVSIAQNGATTVLRWTDIRAVYRLQRKMTVNFIPIIDDHKYTIEKQDGVKIVVDKTYEKIGDLGNAILTAVTRVRLPAALEALKRGESLPFGQFTIRLDGLGFRDRVYPWRDMTSVGISQGCVQVQLRTGGGLPGQAPFVSSVPNLHLFFTLVYSFLERKLTVGASPTTPAG